MNHTRFPKEDHLPDRAHRDNKVTKGDRVENVLESSCNVMTHVDAREGKWRGIWRMEWVASTLYTTSEHGVSSITTADPYTSAASSGLNWRPLRFKWTRPFRRKTKSGFCACASHFNWPLPCLSRMYSARGVMLKIYPLLAPRLPIVRSYVSASSVCMHRHVMGCDLYL